MRRRRRPVSKAKLTGKHASAVASVLAFDLTTNPTEQQQTNVLVWQHFGA